MKEIDNQLIQAALQGNQKSLEQLIKKHQDWIFNMAFAFTCDRAEAQDLTQEVLIKMITKLSAFQQKSAFRTWLFRIIKNHFLNMKRGKNEDPELNFDVFGKGLDGLPDESLANYSFEVENKILVKEAKLSCMKGMLLCLDREQRMIFLIGEMFEFPDTVGAEIMEMSKGNFRVKLHRAKKQLYSFMDNKCGLINKNNSCRCARKTAGFIRQGYVNPKTLQFQKDAISTVEEQVDKKVSTYGNEVISAYQKLYQQHPFLQSPESLEGIRNLLASDTVRATFNFT